MREVIAFLENLPPSLTYLILGVGAATENVVPPLPADTFVVLGSFLATHGRATLTMVFLVTWVANVSSAFLVYLAGFRYGQAFFQTRLGERILDPTQMETVTRFYDRWGMAAIFVTRFLPGLRAIVPVFAGVTHQKALPVGVPIVVASGLWYGLLVLVGRLAAENLNRIMSLFQELNRGLLAVALVLVALVAWWWLRTRAGGAPSSGDRSA